MAFSIINPLYPRPAYSGSAAVSGTALTVTSTAAVQLSGIGANVDIVTVECQTNSVYVTFDTTTPAANAAHIMYPGDKADWSKATAKAAKFVATSTTNALIYASQFQV